ncbi:MAG: hypothetical protein ACREMA_05265, partial [Longimicrobiales bacterium]
MTDYVSYERGLGGFTFSSGQFAELEALRAQLASAISADPYEVGLGGDVYNAILRMISNTVNDEYVAKPGVDPAVWAWIDGAVKVNAADGFFADFIRDYTAAQFELRGLSSPLSPEDLNQGASNNIALNLVIDILANGNLPGISGLGAIDAGAAASLVFAHDGVQEYAPWAGTLLFPFLGYGNFYRDLLLNDGQVVATIPHIDDPGATDTYTVKYATGTYDLVASLQATEMAAQSAALSDLRSLGQAFGNLIFGIRDVPSPDQGQLIADTTQWFNDYYGLAAGTFNVGADTVFNPAWSLAFDEYDYFVGTYGDDSLTATGTLLDSLDDAVLNGGLGNDLVNG